MRKALARSRIDGRMHRIESAKMVNGARVLCMKISQFNPVSGALAVAVLWLACGCGLSTTAAAQVAAKPKVMTPQLAILDTDIGDDIDDAFALALVLRSPELKILGITTAYGDTELRALLVERYLNAVGRDDIPVYIGIPTPHSNVFTQAAYAQPPTLQLRDTCMHQLLSVSQLPTPQREQDRYDACEKDRRDAVGFILQIARAHPGQITLIAIGPLVNIQAAIERDPATFRQLKRVVLMGGSIYRGYGDANAPPDAEWNINRDPAGAKALLASGVPVFMMPLDSTQIHLETRDREAIFSHGSPLTDQLTLLYHQWVAGSDGHPVTPTLFDPVAVAYAVRPDLCPATPMRLEVDDKGYTRPVQGSPNVQVCLKSDESAFLGLLLDRIIGDEAR
jgi:inosine-uridine nucleoside N-ribohydrolase